MLTRRDLVRGAALGSMLPWPTLARAASTGDRKLVFVFAQGGWDPTRVFASEFDNAAVDMEVDAEVGTAGNFRFVDHADRPNVRAFFEANHERTLVFNGVLVRSIAHEICTMIALTGTTSGASPDWPAVVGDASRDDYTLPHLVLGGPSFPGDLGVAVARTGTSGQLAQLLDGDALQVSDQPVRGMSRPSSERVDAWVTRRAQARAAAARSTADGVLSGDFAAAMDRMRELKDLRYGMSFRGGATLADQVDVIVDALSLGVARCVSVGAGAAGSWDTHANNDAQQSPLWESLFSGLGQLVRAMQSAPGTHAPTLADETAIVVLSEMGRTPKLNVFSGKDHWPYTSVMIVGDGVVGDRVVGALDESYYGRNVDPASGDVTDSGQVLSAEAVGATVLALAGVDPGPHVSGVQPIEGVLG